MSNKAFKTDLKSFKKNTIKRTIKDLFFITLLNVTIFTDAFNYIGIFLWVKVVILTLSIAYVFYEINSFPKTVKFIESMTVSLERNKLIMKTCEFESELRYSDLEISKIVKLNEGIKKIYLKAPYGNPVCLENFNNMDELYNELISRVAANHV